MLVKERKEMYACFAPKGESKGKVVYTIPIKTKKIRVVKYKNGVFQNQLGDEYFA